MAVMSRKPRVVLVLRASVNAEDRTTLITQESEGRAYCDRKGYEVVAVFTDDGKSGFKPGTPRPGRDAAMKMIERQQADILMVWKLDRLVRNLMQFVALWGRIEKAGGQFISVVEEWANTTTAMGKLMLMIVATFAEMESEMKRDRALPFHKYRAENGLPPGGPRPFGYQRENGCLLIDGREADSIRMMANMVLDGKSLGSIVALGIVGSTGKPLSTHGVKALLTSPTIAGLRLHSDTLHQGNWPAILDRVTWDMLCIMLGDPSRKTNFSDGKPAYLLTGIMECSKDGGTMVRKRHPSGDRYRCRECGNGIPIALADEAVEAFLMDAISPAAWQSLKEQGRAYDPDIMAALDAELEMMDDMKASGELSPERYRKQNAAIMERMNAARTADPLDLPDISDLQSGWKGLSLSDQRSIISTLLKSVTLTLWDASTRLGIERIEIQRAC